MKDKKYLSKYLLIFLLIFYYGIEGKNMEITNYLDFLKNYFDNFQKYLFMGTLITVLLMSNNKNNYLEPEIKIRLENNMFNYIWSRKIKEIFINTFFIILSFLAVAFFFKYDNIIFIINVGIFTRIFLFMLSCYVIKDIGYFITGKNYIGLALVAAINFLILVVTISINYYIKVNMFSNENLLLILSIYEIIIIFTGLTYLYLNYNKKEIL